MFFRDEKETETRLNESATEARNFLFLFLSPRSVGSLAFSFAFPPSLFYTLLSRRMPRKHVLIEAFTAAGTARALLIFALIAATSNALANVLTGSKVHEEGEVSAKRSVEPATVHSHEIRALFVSKETTLRT